MKKRRRENVRICRPFWLFVRQYRYNTKRQHSDNINMDIPCEYQRHFQIKLCCLLVFLSMSAKQGIVYNLGENKN